MNKVIFIVFLLIFSNVHSQEIRNKPKIDIQSFDSSTYINFTYKVVATDEISFYKDLKISTNCDRSFVDVLITLQQYDSLSHKYTAPPCVMDIDPVLGPEGDFGKKIKLREGPSECFTFSFDKQDLTEGSYRVKVRFLYFTGERKRYIESNYIYFRVNKK